MAFYITYQKDEQQHELEWVAGNGWTIDSIRECFNVRFPQAEIINIEARPCCCL
jgi:hypothetical protein